MKKRAGWREGVKERDGEMERGSKRERRREGAKERDGERE